MYNYTDLYGQRKQNFMAKIKQRILILILTFVMLGSVFIVSGCGYEQLTNEQHIERISARVQERFFGERADYPYTDFTVTILYNFAGEPRFFMVKFEQNGFFYGTIYRNEYYVDDNDNFFRGNIGMPMGQRGWLLHEVMQYKNHFYVANITNERKYILPSHFAKHGLLHPMVRDGEYFVAVAGGGGRNISVNNIQVVSPNYRGVRISNIRW